MTAATDETGETVALQTDEDDGSPGSISSPPSTVEARPAAENVTETAVIDFDDHVKELPTLSDIHYVILDCSTMSYVDSVGVKILRQVSYVNC